MSHKVHVDGQDAENMESIAVDTFSIITQLKSYCIMICLPRYFGEKTIWSVNNETVCRSWRSSLRSMRDKLDLILYKTTPTAGLSHYVVFECRTELRGPIRHLSGKIC